MGDESRTAAGNGARWQQVAAQAGAQVIRGRFPPGVSGNPSGKGGHGAQAASRVPTRGEVQRFLWRLMRRLGRGEGDASKAFAIIKAGELLFQHLPRETPAWVTSPLTPEPATDTWAVAAPAPEPATAPRDPASTTGDETPDDPSSQSPAHPPEPAEQGYSRPVVDDRPWWKRG